jgi:hypothetical protein
MSTHLTQRPNSEEACNQGHRASASQQRDRIVESLKRVYHADQQVKWLHLQAEVDTLLLELQAMKQQRSNQT